MKSVIERESLLRDRLDESFGEIVWEAQVDSTNNRASELALRRLESVVVADAQYAGQGRLRRSFSSEQGGMYLSIGVCLNEIFPQNEAPDLNLTLHFPLLAALAVTDAIQNVCGKIFGVDIIPDIKWPNDIQIKGKKIGGILCKAAQSGGKWFIIVGIGINVNNILPADLTEAANLASMLDVKPQSEDDWNCFIEELAAETAMQVRKDLKKGLEDGGPLLDEVERRCITIGKNVEVPERGVKGKAIQIGDDGSLCVETEDGDYEVVKSGDVIIYK